MYRPIFGHFALVFCDFGLRKITRSLPEIHETADWSHVGHLTHKTKLCEHVYMQVSCRSDRLAKQNKRAPWKGGKERHRQDNSTEAECRCETAASHCER